MQASSGQGRARANAVIRTQTALGSGRLFRALCGASTHLLPPCATTGRFAECCPSLSQSTQPQRTAATWMPRLRRPATAAAPPTAARARRRRLLGVGPGLVSPWTLALRNRRRNRRSSSSQWPFPPHNLLEAAPLGIGRRNGQHQSGSGHRLSPLADGSDKPGWCAQAAPAPLQELPAMHGGSGSATLAEGLLLGQLQGLCERLDALAGGVLELLGAELGRRAGELYCQPGGGPDVFRPKAPPTLAAAGGCWGRRLLGTSQACAPGQCRTAASCVRTMHIRACARLLVGDLHLLLNPSLLLGPHI